jgi:hypothetical protein
VCVRIHVADHSAGKPLDKSAQKRIHAERMLAHTERRSRQAAKLVDKWKQRLAELDRAGVAAKQARLWADEQT